MVDLFHEARRKGKHEKPNLYKVRSTVFICDCLTSRLLLYRGRLVSQAHKPDSVPLL